MPKARLPTPNSQAPTPATQEEGVDQVIEGVSDNVMDTDIHHAKSSVPKENVAAFVEAMKGHLNNLYENIMSVPIQGQPLIFPSSDVAAVLHQCLSQFFMRLPAHDPNQQESEALRLHLSEIATGPVVDALLKAKVKEQSLRDTIRTAVNDGVNAAIILVGQDAIRAAISPIVAEITASIVDALTKRYLQDAIQAVSAESKTFVPVEAISNKRKRRESTPEVHGQESSKFMKLSESDYKLINDKLDLLLAIQAQQSTNTQHQQNVTTNGGTTATAPSALLNVNPGTSQVPVNDESGTTEGEDEGQ